MFPLASRMQTVSDSITLAVSAKAGASGSLTAPGLFPGGLAQGFVDPVLPSRASLLEMFKHVLIDPERHQFLDAGNGVGLGRRFRLFLRHLLERRLRFGAGIVQGSRSPRLVGHRSNSFKQNGGEVTFGERRDNGKDGLAGVFRTLPELDRGCNRSARGNAAGNALIARQGA